MYLREQFGANPVQSAGLTFSSQNRMTVEGANPLSHSYVALRVLELTRLMLNMALGGFVKSGHMVTVVACRSRGGNTLWQIILSLSESIGNFTVLASYTMVKVMYHVSFL